MIDVKYKFQGGRTQLVSVKNNATVEDVLKKTGINPKGYNIKVKGQPADATTELTATSLITFTEKVKGGALRCDQANGRKYFLIKA